MANKSIEVLTYLINYSNILTKENSIYIHDSKIEEKYRITAEDLNTLRDAGIETRNQLQFILDNIDTGDIGNGSNIDGDNLNDALNWLNDKINEGYFNSVTSFVELVSRPDESYLGEYSHADSQFGLNIEVASELRDIISNLDVINNIINESTGEIDLTQLTNLVNSKPDNTGELPVLDPTNESLSGTAINQQDVNKETKTKITTLSNDVSEIQEQIGDMGALTGDIASNISDLEDTVSDLEDTVSQLADNKTEFVSVSSPTTESISGDAVTQKIVNEEDVAKNLEQDSRLSNVEGRVSVIEDNGGVGIDLPLSSDDIFIEDGDGNVANNQSLTEYVDGLDGKLDLVFNEDGTLKLTSDDIVFNDGDSDTSNDQTLTEIIADLILNGGGSAGDGSTIHVIDPTTGEDALLNDALDNLNNAIGTGGGSGSSGGNIGTDGNDLFNAGNLVLSHATSADVYDLHPEWFQPEIGKYLSFNDKSPYLWVRTADNAGTQFNNQIPDGNDNHLITIAIINPQYNFSGTITDPWDYSTNWDGTPAPTPPTGGGGTGGDGATTTEQLTAGDDEITIISLTF